MQPILDLRFGITLGIAGARLLDYAEAALFEEAETIMAVSRDDFVPVDEGTLKGTGHVGNTERHGGEIRVTLGYGGPAEAYAEAVHQHLSDTSPPSWRTAEASGHGVQFSPAGHGPNYLAEPLRLASGTFVHDMAARIRAKAGL
jgi:hypothetical protein